MPLTSAEPKKSENVKRKLENRVNEVTWKDWLLFYTALRRSGYPRKDKV